MDTKENRTKGLNYDEAMAAIRAGSRVTRAAWEDPGSFLWLLPEADVQASWCRDPVLKAVAEAQGGSVKARSAIRLLTQRDNSGKREIVTGWHPGAEAMLATDYEIVTFNP